MDAQYTGKQIADRRKTLGLTQKELAEKLHVTDKAVSKWERGMNFPDLGLMENLATALGTTPACLLGLEDATQNEVVNTLTEISTEQLENAREDMRWIGWSSIVIAVFLFLVYWFIPRQTVRAYQLLYGLIAVVYYAGLYVLVKYGEIKHLEPTDAFLFIGIFLSVLIYLLIQMFTGSSPHALLGLLLIGIAAICLQWLFWRIMRPYPAKLLPAIGSTLFAIWHVLLGSASIQFALPAVCCVVVCAVFMFKDKPKCKIPPKRLLIILCILFLILLILCFVFYPELVQIYVQVRYEHLEAYAQSLLTEQQYTLYGLWDVASYPELGMVEFCTGGSGLAPGSIYEGFYYSADDIHLPYQGYDTEIEILGDTAYWKDAAENSDNWGKSARILPHWFWFEAHY